MLFPLKRREMLWEWDRREDLAGRPAQLLGQGQPGGQGAGYPQRCAQEKSFSFLLFAQPPPPHLKHLSINPLNTKDRVLSSIE